MKFEIITLADETTKPQFPLDLIFKKSEAPKERVVTTDINGNLINDEKLNSHDVDYVTCRLFPVSDFHNPAFVLGSFLIDIQKIDGKFEEVLAVYSHDKKKFGVIGFYYERD